MPEILLTSLIIALFCVSWDILLTYEPEEPKRNQMLLYWLRKPHIDKNSSVTQAYQKEINEINNYYTPKINEAIVNDLKIILSTMQHDRDEELLKADTGKDKLLDYQFYLKPILLCKYCFPSFYGTIIFLMLNGFTINLWKEWLLSIVCSVILVGIISGIHEKLIK